MSNGLILKLSSKLQAISVEQLLPYFNIDNVRFADALDNDFVGFYDWLRLSEDQICGVRLNPFEFSKKTIFGIPEFPYLKRFSDQIIEIYFTDDIKYVEQLSCDQDFGKVKIYLSENFEYAVGLDLENLTLIEKENLRLIWGM